MYERQLLLGSEHVDCFRRMRTSALFELLQVVSIRHTEELGMGREKTLDKGLLWVVARMHAQIGRKPEYDERITVRTWPGETMHVVETRERLVETIAERDQTIAEQKERIAELEQIEAKYNAIIAEQEAKALAEKQAKAKVFAEKQGLDSADVAVAEAIEKLDYSKIAELAMAEAEEERHEEPEMKITLASFIDLEANTEEYGGLLKPTKK